MDWIGVTCIAQRAEVAWSADPELSSWLQRSRLNAGRGIRDHLNDPQMTSALARLFANIEPAIAKLETFMAEIPQAGAGRAAAAGLQPPGRGRSLHVAPMGKSARAAPSA